MFVSPFLSHFADIEVYFCKYVYFNRGKNCMNVFMKINETLTTMAYLNFFISYIVWVASNLI